MTFYSENHVVAWKTCCNRILYIKILLIHVEIEDYKNCVDPFDGDFQKRLRHLSTLSFENHLSGFCSQGNRLEPPEIIEKKLRLEMWPPTFCDRVGWNWGTPYKIECLLGKYKFWKMFAWIQCFFITRNKNSLYIIFIYILLYTVYLL